VDPRPRALTGRAALLSVRIPVSVLISITGVTVCSGRDLQHILNRLHTFDSLGHLFSFRFLRG
jgi:hypothetical protein